LDKSGNLLLLPFISLSMQPQIGTDLNKLSGVTCPTTGISVPKYYLQPYLRFKRHYAYLVVVVRVAKTNNELQFEVTGAGELAGFSSGNPVSHESLTIGL